MPKIAYILYNRLHKGFSRAYEKLTRHSIFVRGTIEDAAKIAEKYGVPLYIVNHNGYSISYKGHKFPRIVK